MKGRWWLGVSWEAWAGLVREGWAGWVVKKLKRVEEIKEWRAQAGGEAKA